MKGEILINGKIIEKSWFTNSKMNKKKIESKSHHKVFVLIIYSEVTLTFKCITLLLVHCYQVASSLPTKKIQFLFAQKFGRN